MSNNSKRHGFFSMNELITTDLDSAKNFYGNLFGWSFTETKTIYGNRYIAASKDGEFIGGMMLKKGNVANDVVPCWDPYICVENIDSSIQKVKQLGGEIILSKTNIPNMGNFCVIKDPQGISFNIIEYTNKN